jgi:adenosylcobinamide-phosphate guanylyltransferase
MRALIMAGGAGSRLALGEKPLIAIHNRPMISYVIDAFREAGCETIAVVSPKTPMTANWCRANNIPVVRAAGSGYIGDMADAVRILEDDSPLFISVSDLPCITPAIITIIIQSYRDCGKDALSTWVPARLVTSCREGMPYRQQIGTIEACPAGINILRGDIIDTVQEEYMLLLEESRLALNVNTAEDLAMAESFLTQNCIS